MFTYLVFFTYFYTDLDEIFGCKNEKKEKVRWNAKGPPFTTGLGVWASRKEGREREGGARMLHNNCIRGRSASPNSQSSPVWPTGRRYLKRTHVDTKTASGRN